MTTRGEEPAFPQLDIESCERDGHGDLIDPFVTSAGGLSKRELFAGMAMQGLLASGPHDCEAAGIAHDAVLFADALLAELEKKQ
jgi:hypothetical protein